MNMYIYIYINGYKQLHNKDDQNYPNLWLSQRTCPVTAARASAAYSIRAWGDAEGKGTH